MKHNIFEDKLRYAWYTTGLKLLAIAGSARMSAGMQSNTMTALLSAASAYLGWSLGDDVMRLRDYVRSAKFLEYRVAHSEYTYYGKGWKVTVDWYPKHESITITRHPGHHDYIQLQLVLRPRKPFAYLIKEKLPF